MPATDQPNQAPQQVSKEASRFLAAIGREAPFLFRALMDSKDKKAKQSHPPKELGGSFEDHAQQLRRLNDAGYGIFVQINVADGVGWKGANIVGATCLFVDFDDVPLQHIERLALPPHLTVETSPGKRHYYWRVADIPIGDHPALQKRLIRLFGSDKSVHDLPRIMRLPGFLHQKNPDAPHLVKVVETANEPPYSIARFLDALAAAERMHTAAAKPIKPLPASISAPGKGPVLADLARTEAMLRHLIGIELLDLGSYDEWFRVGVAIHATHGDDGYPLWVELSSEAAGFKGEDDCAKKWSEFDSEREPAKQLTLASFYKMASDNGWNVGARLSGLPEEKVAGKGSKPDAATTIIGLVEEAGDEHFVGKDGQVYVTYTGKRSDGNSRRVTVRLDSSQYRNLLALRFHEDAVIKVAPKEQLSAAIALMEARARAVGEQREVFLRYAHHDGKLYVNLDPQNGRVIEIDASQAGWREVEVSPVPFIEGSGGALPTPERGGTLELFEKHFNVSSDDLLRTIAFMLSPSQPVPVYPILLVEGEPGTAKSNFGDKILALTDPQRLGRKAGRCGPSTEERNLHVRAARCSVLLMDNVSRFDNEMADQLCRLATGSASSFRRLNTNDEEHQFFVACPLVVTCISTPSARSDLLSRAMRVTTLAPERRRTEQAVWRDFDADAGKMLGLLFSCISIALRTRPAVERLVETGQLEVTRMGDFGEWVEAAGEGMGLRSGQFAALLREEQSVAQAEAARRDPIVEALVRYFARPGAEPINATARELRDVLASLGFEGELPFHNQFKDRLRRQAAGLLALGIKVVDKVDAHSKTTKFTISAVEGAQGGEAADLRDDSGLPF